MTFDNSDDKLSKAGLVIAPYKLDPAQSYTFVVSAQFATSSTAYTFEITISTGADIIFANAGVSRTVGTSNDIILSAEIENSGYANIQDAYDLMTCTWTCTDESTSADCTIPTIPDCFNNDLSGQLPAGKYIFAVTVINPSTGSQAVGDSSNLEVLNGQVPLVGIKSSELSPSSGSINFNLQSLVDSSTVTGDITYQWSMEAECFGVSFLTFDLLQGSTVATDPKEANVKFLPQVLAPGASYCVRLTIQDSNNADNAGVSTLIVKARDAPFGGVCTVNKETGTPFSLETFDFSCVGWVTDPLSYPLQYIVGMKVRDAATSYDPLTPQTPSPLFQTSAPTGAFDFLVTVIDSAGSTNTVPIVIKISVGSSSLKKRSRLEKRDIASDCQAATTYVSSSCASFANTKDVVKTLSALAVAQKGLPLKSDLKTVDLTESSCGLLQAELLSCFDQVLVSNEWYLDSIKAAPFASALINGVNSSKFPIYS